MQAHVIALALLGLIFLIVLPVKECFRRHLLPFQLASRGRDDRHRGHISSDPSTCPTRYRDRFCLSGTNSNVEDALNVLQKYDAEYIERMKVTRASTGEGGSSKSGGLVEVKTPKQVEFERAQILKADGIKKERELLQIALKATTRASTSIVLGIKAESGTRALAVLKAWVTHMELPRGNLMAVDENNDPVEVDAWNDSSVYIKYNSSDIGNAYMKPYEGAYFGVLFQPRVEGKEEDFLQYGDLPLSTFR